ncbi:MAG: hypothetical protein ACFFB3_06560 [Candidatus Hodarchaeota archaeon]
MTEINLPYNFRPRKYQFSVLKALDQGIKRAVCVWHRRSGKDKTFLNYMVKRMFERVGIYYYFFPNYNQGRKILWDGIDRDGFRYMDHIPEMLRMKTNNQEMKITLKNNSIFQIIGTDNIDSIMGTNPVGCVFSEYSLQDPEAWDFIRPILRENGGWAVFNYTPRGRNHGFVLFNMAQHNPAWFCELLTVDHTSVITPDMIQAERDEGMDEALVQQEYWCSFEAALQACFFGDSLARHKNTMSGHIGNLESNRADDLEFVKDRNGILEVWRYPYSMVTGWDGLNWEHRYAIGTDICEGLGQSYSVAYVFDRLLDEFVARLRSNKIDAFTWANMVYDLSLFYDRALICPERNGAGITTCKRLEDLNAPLYVRQMPAKAGYDMTKDIGWLQTNNAKFELAGDLKEYFAFTQGNVYDRILLEECSTFIKTENHRLEPDEGFLADCVIAAGLTLQASRFLGAAPRQIQPDLTGWRARLHQVDKEETVWARP